MLLNLHAVLPVSADYKLLGALSWSAKVQMAMQRNLIGYQVLWFPWEGSYCVEKRVLMHVKSSLKKL